MKKHEAKRQNSDCITGARRGMGRAIALALAREGANVVVSDISQEDCQKVVDEIEKLGRKGLALKCDVSFSDDVEDSEGV